MAVGFGQSDFLTMATPLPGLGMYIEKCMNTTKAQSQMD